MKLTGKITEIREDGNVYVTVKLDKVEFDHDRQKYMYYTEAVEQLGVRPVTIEFGEGE